MRVRLRIEHVVLDGLPLQASDGPLVQAALAAELGRRLAEPGVPRGLLQAGALRVLDGGEVPGVSAVPAEAGRQIARAVAAGLGVQRETVHE
jgi:hypothetical protein